MGNSSYSLSSRNLRAASMDYATNSLNDNFTQNKLRIIHESMDPKGAKIREARDSKAHPNSYPIVLALDLTGSMGSIPQFLVQEGLPKIMAGIIQHGVPDPALLFLGVGDTQCDQYPLQVGQFESGDEELDTWLTRTYIEKGGGGNEGESYLLAWFYAALHTATDSWDKRKQKGTLFTCGDEPSLSTLHANAIKHLMCETPQAGYTDHELLALVQEKWNVYHLHIMQGSAGHRSLGYWKQLLGDNCIEVKDYKDVAEIISGIIVKNAIIQSSNDGEATKPTDTKDKKEKKEDEIYL